ncbi:MAG: DEAD/DEAH box helicase [Actinomycetota bacterium]|nr:DEAD/DEAH box helicase [Actinomycetota bacterium]MEC9316796.1 DEAD/DEAH box helicase [Actinomycetota bacterium]MEE3186737.1 DEAD/DEAH box helicase [Actinomycetota bacterium]
MTTTFAQLGVPQDLIDTLAKQGIESPFAIQTLAIGDAMAGRDVCGKAKTGSGKTLAFSLPAIAHTERHQQGKPTTLVLTPTRELANQIAGVVEPLAKARQLRPIAVYGGTNIDKQIETISNGIDIIIATPGRLIDLIDRTAVDVAAVQRVVVDEADRMADMGFLPQVEWILRHIKANHQTMLFSATLDGAVDTVVKRHLTDPVFHEVFEPEVTVSEMGHVFMAVHKMNRVQVASRIIGQASKTLLFTRTKRGADQLERELRSEGVKAAAIHGDLRQTQREKALNDFSKGKLKALVATDVAARGLHVDDVGVVIHYNPPEDHKTYLHRSGRTARAGATGTAVTMFLWDEELQVRQLQRRLGLKLPLHEVFSNDARLDDLPAWVRQQN